MRITSRKLNVAHLSANEEALVRCQAALELKDRGDYQGAKEIMGRAWKRVGDWPDTKTLHPSVAAEVLLCVGILTRWIGSKEGIQEAQEAAKNLISESIQFFENIGDRKKVAAARMELACCYWREGALDEARIILVESLEKLTSPGNTRAKAILRLSIVEWSAERFNKALTILVQNTALFDKIPNNAVKGAYHNQLAMVLRKLNTLGDENVESERIIRHYQKADHFFKLARNNPYRADVKNNLAFLLYKLSRFKEAQANLEQARRLRVRIKDKVGVAQIDDTRAQVLTAEKKFKEAEVVARGAVRVLEKSGHQCLLADALITHGIAIARLKQSERAQFTFQKAIEIGHQVGALNKAGIAALTLIEELDELPADTFYAAYDRASEWLAKSQSQDILLRLNAAARKVFANIRGELKPEVATETVFNTPCNFPLEVLKFEAGLIGQALAQSNGSVTHAAQLLGMTYQGLAYVIGSRHHDLLKARSPIHRRGGPKNKGVEVEGRSQNA
ncbi:MAG TPA: helix-turn-helix domain-containing protein [Pyrinomonadaceae bacterium]|nr:helix-turn-helix domain-containing protein [Pyrinomonadaceae bacterium]